MKKNDKSRIITYGTFDLFHHGHVRLLKRLSLVGDELYVGCSTDAFNDLKDKRAVVSYEHRCEMLLSCRYVTHVFPEEDWAQKRTDIVKYEADIFAMGDDWAGKFDDLADLATVIYLPRTENVSTTQIRAQIAQLQARATGQRVLRLAQGF